MVEPQAGCAIQVGWEIVVDAFLWAKRVKGLSHRTLELYAFVLQQFYQMHECPSPLTCPPSHIMGYITCLQERGVRSTSIISKIRMLKSFFSWLVQEGLRNDNPTTTIPAPKSSQPLPKTVTENHFLATIATLNPNKFAHLRDLTLFVLAFDTGARLSELLGLKVGDLDLLNRMAKVKGKGDKERVIVFGQKSAYLLRKYLTHRMVKEGRNLSPDDLVFVTNKFTPLTRHQALHNWHNAQRRAGLKPLPFHGLRHGFARLWLLRGGDALSLQLLLGHTSAEVTKRYVTLWGTDLKALHAKVSPVDSLNLKRVR